MIPPHHRARARPIAQHEMGHFVIAKALGFNTGEVSLTLTGFDGHRGGATLFLYEPLGSLPEICRYLEKRVLVLLSGAIAETLSASNVPGRGVNEKEASVIILGPTAESDLGKARELVAMLRNILHPQSLDRDETSEQKKEIMDRLWDRAVALVTQYEDLIVGLAGALVESIKPTGRETYQGIMTEETLAEIRNLRSMSHCEP